MTKPKESDQVMVGFRTTKALRLRARRQALEEGISLQELLRRATREYIDEKRKRKKRGS